MNENSIDPSAIQRAVEAAIRDYGTHRLQVRDPRLKVSDRDSDSREQLCDVPTRTKQGLSKRPHIDIRIDIHVCGDLVIHNFPSPGSAAAPSTPDAVGSPPPGGARTTE